MSSNNDSDTSTDTGVPAKVAKTHLAITIDADRVARFYIDGNLVETTAALADTHDLIPYIGVHANTTGGKAIHVHGQAISRVIG